MPIIIFTKLTIISGRMTNLNEVNLFDPIKSFKINLSTSNIITRENIKLDTEYIILCTITSTILWT